MEEWRDVIGFEGRYEVSSLGRVRNAKTGHVLKPQRNTWGYAHVEMQYKTYVIHKLVADAFIPEVSGHTQINHKDENKFNNALTNIERCTARYNMNYGTRKERAAQKTRKPVVQISRNGTIIAHYASAREAHDLHGFCYKHISDCCLGRRKSHAGYMWRFA